MDITKLNPTITRDEFDAAVGEVAARLRIEGAKRSAHKDLTEMSIRTAINFCQLVNVKLFGPRSKPPTPDQVKQGRFANTLAIDQRSRIEFRNTAWWFWSKDRQSRIGPFDTEDLAAEAMVSLSHYEDTPQS